MITWTPKIKKAIQFASDAHKSIGQKRKYTGEDYFDSHVMEVVELVSEETDNEDIICSAAIHDVLEDIKNDNRYNATQIFKNFGQNVLNFCMELECKYDSKDFPDWNRERRKKHELDRLSKISDSAKLIKCADIISNTKDVIKQDKEFAKVYLPEKIAILKSFKDVGKFERIFYKAWEQVNTEYKKL